MRTFLRCLGWLFAALAATFLTRDLYQLVDQGTFQPLSAGFVWFTLHPESLQLAEAGISRHVSQFLWHPVISTILTWPAFAVFGAFAVLFFLLSPPPSHHRSRSGELFKQD